MEYTIEVTQADIENGSRMSTTSCPIALAGSRVFGIGFHWVVNNGWYPYAYDGFNDYDATDDRAANFVKSFDNNEPVEPFTFTVKEVV